MHSSFAVRPQREGKYAEGLDLLSRGCCIEAVEALSEAAESLKERPDAWTQLGVALVGMDQSLKARACFEKSLSLSAEQPGLWSNLGALLLHAGETVAALQAFHRALELRPELLPARRNACLALYTLGRDEEAGALLSDSPDRRVLHSQALRERGDLEGATEALREAIRLLEAEGFSAPVPVGDAFLQESARKALVDAKDRLDAAGLECFLLAGTLLGAIRNGDILAHDKDLDLGLAWEVERAQVVGALCPGGLFTVPWQQGILPPDRPWYRSFCHAESGCALDVFFLRPDGDGLLCGFEQHPVPVLSRVSAFGLRDWPWLERTWKIPDPPERYLEEIYGPGWRVPDLHYNTVLSNPARTQESLPVVLCLGYFRVYEALKERKWARAESLTAQIRMHMEDPFLIGLQARIEGYAHPGPIVGGPE